MLKFLKDIKQKISDKILIYNIKMVVRYDRKKLVYFLNNILNEKVHSGSSKDNLIFLFHLEDLLYQYQASTAIRYNGGAHPKHRLTQYVNFFTSRIGENESVLDIGCANGHLSFAIATQCNAKVIGIDIEASKIKDANRHNKHPNITYVHGNVLEELPINQVDTIVLSNVLEHLPNRTHFLKKVQKVYNPQRFLIRVPVFDRDWRIPLRRELGVEWRLDSTHETEYLLTDFQDEIKNSGLLVKEIRICWGEIWAEVHSHD